MSTWAAATVHSSDAVWGQRRARTLLPSLLAIPPVPLGMKVPAKGIEDRDARVPLPDSYPPTQPLDLSPSSSLSLLSPALI